MDLPVRTSSSDQTMELYATGFNAWNQLTFEPSPADEEPDDVFTFTKVLAAKSIGRIASELSYTVARQDTTWAIAGSSPGQLLHREDNQGFLFNSPSAISGDGKVLAARDSDCSPSNHATVQYSSLGAWKANKSTDSWPCKAAVRQITAYDAGFIILLEDGAVLSCGDPRFRDCLGREVDESSPASEPGVIQDLNDLGEPIKNIAAAGYTAAALTESGGLYLWGMAAPGSHSRHNVFQDITELPNYFEVDGDKDVQDIGLGESHAIALTTDGCIYIIGSNTNGQIGLGKEVQDPISSWKKMDFTPPEGWAIVAVEAGPRSSFIVTEKVKQSQSS
ncbi:e3 ubiquitin ligase HERC6 [Fusarium denticulatum]|uniref:E3 ubiquitin ligase HERC6 n=1 Tax=Fusarium denticulatum TaxID=48507 RepID=A0A8H5TBH6_9HYPO|nr:e3 ubiquitin ligase HERC6 [Fusarium denticulatum]